ncbi:hypothetical protein P7228_10895 [Altererythrobacter arenosus]|uniref:DUF962 domain-containing protein n=1 Tax=Altererythrobacter arenosus TaxID=3032592 RepID=A0ABY8FRH2_9SPHN|nr:hypothetical protein [Altererythrobacter sp. CAU 1644]WFL76503.1 hypothetical protein P7228_10895 [Altererythrobacter sp. CAU 1644]
MSMKEFLAETHAWQSVVLRLVVLIPAGLLVFYHLTMIYDVLMGRGLSSNATYNFVQLALRLSIVVSLVAVVVGKRVALLAMWASIAGLIATQYFAHLGWVQADFTAGRHPLSYLKGFIFPSIITAAELLRARLKS